MRQIKKIYKKYGKDSQITDGFEITTETTDKEILNNISCTLKTAIGQHKKDTVITVRDLLQRYILDIEGITDVEEVVAKLKVLETEEAIDFLDYIRDIIEDAEEAETKPVDLGVEIIQADWDKFFPFMKIYIDESTRSTMLTFSMKHKTKKTTISEILKNQKSPQVRGIYWAAEIMSLLTDADRKEEFVNMWKETVITGTCPNARLFLSTTGKSYVWKGAKDFLTKQLTDCDEYNIGVNKAPIRISNDPNVLAINYYDLEAIKSNTGPFPTISDWLENNFDDMSIKYIRLFLAKIVVADNPDRKALYIQDEVGGLGKSTFSSALFKVLNSYCNNSAGAWESKKTGNFVWESIWNKAFISDDDVKNAQIIRSNLFHKFCSKKDNVNIEYKGLAAFTAQVGGSVMMMGNIDIKFEDQFHMTDRIIYVITKRELSTEYKRKYCKTDATGKYMYQRGKIIFKNQSEFSNKISEEMPYFLADCFNEWTKAGLNIHKDSIFVDDEMYDRVVDRYTTTDSYVTANNIDAAFEITGDVEDFITIHDLNIKVADIANKQYEGEEIKKILRGKLYQYGLGKPKSKKINGKVHKVMQGVRIKKSVYSVDRDVPVSTIPKLNTVDFD